MRTEALVLLEGDDRVEARRLVATWPTVGNRELSPEDLLDAWELVSGVHSDTIRIFEPQLFENEILGPGGFVDPEAVDFVKEHIGAALHRAGRPRKKPA